MAEGPLPQTPALDAILQDDVIGWAASYPYRKEENMAGSQANDSMIRRLEKEMRSATRLSRASSRLLRIRNAT